MRLAQDQNLVTSKIDWLAVTYSGALTGALTIVTSVSLAAMIFSGNLSGHLAYGINIALITAAVTGLILPLAGSSDFSISIPQDRIAPILAIMATGIAAAAPPSATDDQVFLSIVVAIVATTLITGAFLLGLGLARAGGLIRFLPYSVLGGFFAGTGWLLVIGGLRVMTGQELDSLAGLIQLAEPDLLLRWLPGLAVALVIIVASRMISSAIALPLILAAGAGLFFFIMLRNGQTLQTLEQGDWLLGPLQSGGFGIFEFSLPQLLVRGDWSIVFAQWANIGTVVVITAVSIILTVSALEMLSGSDIDMNRELRVTGIANLAAGLVGGMVGFHSLSFSSLTLELRARHRASGIIAAVIAGAALFLGADNIGFLPRMVVGGLLLYIGFSILAKWLIASWSQLPLGEYLVIPLILVVIATVGFIEGLVAGLLAALIQFVLNYSRTPVIRYALSGKHARSTVERGLDDERCLSEAGERLYVLKLRGYLFFGTTVQLSIRLRERAEDRSKVPLAFVVLDFEHIHGIDSSAAFEFNRMRLIARKEGFVLVLTGLKPELHHQLLDGHILEKDSLIQEFADLDHGLEWCENQLLETLGDCRDRVSVTALKHLSRLFADEAAADEFLGYLSEVQFHEGDELIKQGDASTDLYFLEEGDVSVYLRQTAGEMVRIRRTGPGTVLGELGFYLNAPRTASVIADGPGRAYRLTADALSRMENRHPALAAALHRFMADLMAERLLRTTHTLEAVLG
jgi:SulP family sulfate permease